MKKKLLTIALAVVLALGCFAGLIACGNNVDGTYYMYMAGEKVEGTSMTFEDGKVSMTMEIIPGMPSTTEIGTYKVDGNKVIVTAKDTSSALGSGEAEIVSSGVLKLGDDMYLCMEGKTPPADDAE